MRLQTIDIEMYFYQRYVTTGVKALLCTAGYLYQVLAGNALTEVQKSERFQS